MLLDLMQIISLSWWGQQLGKCPQVYPELCLLGRLRNVLQKVSADKASPISLLLLPLLGTKHRATQLLCFRMHFLCYIFTLLIL